MGALGKAATKVIDEIAQRASNGDEAAIHFIVRDKGRLNAN
jgi:hypothetical protein